MTATSPALHSAPSHATQAARWTLGGAVGAAVGALVAAALHAYAPSSDLHTPLAHFALVGAALGAASTRSGMRPRDLLTRPLLGGLLGLLAAASAFALSRHAHALPALAAAALAFAAVGAAVGLARSAQPYADARALHPHTHRAIGALAHAATFAVGLLCAVTLFFDLDSPPWLTSPYVRDVGSGALLGFFAALGAPLTQLIAHAAAPGRDDADAHPDALAALLPDDADNARALHSAHQRALARLRQARAQGALSPRACRALLDDLSAHTRASDALIAATAQLTDCARQHPARRIDAQHQQLTRALAAAQDPVARAEHRASLHGLQRQRDALACVRRDLARLSARLHRARVAAERLELQLALRLVAPAQECARGVAQTPPLVAHDAAQAHAPARVPARRAA